MTSNWERIWTWSSPVCPSLTRLTGDRSRGSYQDRQLNSHFADLRLMLCQLVWTLQTVTALGRRHLASRWAYDSLQAIQAMWDTMQAISRPEPVEYVPGGQRLQESALGVPRRAVLQYRTEIATFTLDQAHEKCRVSWNSNRFLQFLYDKALEEMQAVATLAATHANTYITTWPTRYGQGQRAKMASMHMSINFMPNW